MPAALLFFSIFVPSGAELWRNCQEKSTSPVQTGVRHQTIQNKRCWVPESAWVHGKPDVSSHSFCKYHMTMKCQAINGPQREKACLWGFANNTGADQPVHPHSLISSFVARFLQSIIC